MLSKMPKIIITALICLFLVACTSTTTYSENGTSNRTTSKANLTEASELNTQLAVGFMQQQKYKPARDKLEKAIEQNPENVTAIKTLAYLYASLGLTEDAEKKYREALDLESDNPDLSNFYGSFLCNNGKYDEAQEHLKVAYSDPFYKSRYLAQSNAGSCYIKQNEYIKAEALLRESLRVNSKLPGSLISMAEIGIKTDRYLMARAYIQRYHNVKAASAESLWLQIQAEKALGAKEHYMKYARQLINDFPDSDEAGWVEAESKNVQFR